MTTPPKSVLVTTDLSPLGDAALPHAITLAKGIGARMLLLSVVEKPLPPSPLYAHYYPTPTPAELESARGPLRKELERRAREHATSGVPIEVLVVDGDPATEIANVAKDRGVEMLVISTHGRTGLRHFLLGSVAERVLKATTCPVLLVR